MPVIDNPPYDFFTGTSPTPTSPLLSDHIVSLQRKFHHLLTDSSDSFENRTTHSCATPSTPPSYRLYSLKLCTTSSMTKSTSIFGKASKINARPKYGRYITFQDRLTISFYKGDDLNCKSGMKTTFVSDTPSYANCRGNSPTPRLPLPSSIIFSLKSCFQNCFLNCTECCENRTTDFCHSQHSTITSFIIAYAL